MAMFDTILLFRLDGSFIAQGLDECINVPKCLNFYQGLFVLQFEVEGLFQHYDHIYDIKAIKPEVFLDMQL